MKKDAMIAAKNNSKLITLLLSSISNLSRIGPAIIKVFNRLNISTIFDLLFHFPLHAEKIDNTNLLIAQNNSLVAIKVKIEEHIKPANNRQPYKILCYTPNGYLTLVFFKIFPSQLDKLIIGNKFIVIGRLQKSFAENQIIHPQEIIAEQDFVISDCNVIYPMTYALTPKFLRQKILEALKIAANEYHKLPEDQREWIDENLLSSMKWPDFISSLKILHYFNGLQNLELQDIARKRLAYDELLSWQIALLMLKNEEKAKKDPLKINLELAEKFLEKLPFKPTLAQIRVTKEISNDIAGSKKMLRLLQGDVGSGKTIVAIYACLLMVALKKQCCVIAPISLLAEQHYSYFKNFLTEFNIKIEILTSKTKKQKRQQIVQDLASGNIDILIATHAVLQDDVKFKNLALAVIDEQHKFGVMQRLKLIEKGDKVDVLLMSATPIPRSLMMTIYGDIDISLLDEKPAKRKKIETLVMSQNRYEDVFLAIKRAIPKGEKVFWVCPAIDEVEDDSLIFVKKKFEELQQVFGASKVALIHGQMKEGEKDKIMQEFASKTNAFEENAPQILVATTVIEVGIDIKEATIMIIENAENFGLSQLHQLRGRVGRADRQSYCILLYGKKYGENARKRLSIMRQSNDGFFIAEEDLKIRGSGELLGTKQSGLPQFKVADLSQDIDLIKFARNQATIIVAKDALLKEEKNIKYNNLLKIFGYESASKIIAGG